MSTLGNRDFNIEFNDSVLETKGWYGSRYEGKQLNGSEINTFTEGDTSFGNTPVIRNLTRNIYVGNAIIGLGDEASSQDPTLTQFPSASYITIEKYLTVNDDDTVSENNYDGSDLDSKIGFYRSFYDDFPPAGDFQLRFLDNTISNFTQDNYKVFFNQGTLHKIATCTVAGTTSIIAASVGAGGYLEYEDPTASSGIGLRLTLQVESNSYVPTGYTGPKTLDNNNSLGDLDTFYTDAIQTPSLEDNTNRFFCTMQSESIDSPIIIVENRTNLARYSTAELRGSFLTGRRMTTAPKSLFPQNYTSANFSQNYTLSKLDTSFPSILTTLVPEEQLPDGVGNLPFIVIPSNLHPYVKQNLLSFLLKAGIDIGTNTVRDISRQNFNLT